MTNSFMDQLGPCVVELSAEPRHARGDFSFTTTYGRIVDLNNVKASDFTLWDTATSLANLCRFLGHCEGFLSVGGHSLRVHDTLVYHYPFASPKLRRSCLMHDAGETIAHDIISPFKRMNMLDEFLAYAARIDDILIAKYDLFDWRTPECEIIHRIDKMVCDAEQLMRTDPYAVDDIFQTRARFQMLAVSLGCQED